jgi:RimJ/RimL family protein N-acetyltransferase
VTAIEHVELRAGPWQLRPPRVEEAADSLTMMLDPDVRQWNPAPLVVDEPSARAWLERGGDWSAGDHATFSVVEPDTGRFLGNVSLHRIDREQLWGAVGYRVAPWARGRGLATAALAAVAGWSFASLGLARLEVCHAVANPASCRVAERAGFLLEGTLRQALLHADGLRYDEHVHGRLATDPWPPR